MYAKLKSIVAIVRTGRKAGVYRAPTPVGHAEIVEPRVLEELAGATFQEFPKPSAESNRSLASTILRFGVIFGAVALVSAIIAGVILRPSIRQAAEPVPVAAPSISAARVVTSFAAA